MAGVGRCETIPRDSVSEPHYRELAVQHVFQASLLLHQNDDGDDSEVIDLLDRAIVLIRESEFGSTSA